MTRLTGFIRNQGELLLKNRQHALLHAVFLAVLPYTAWLSVAVIALVTLRKGYRQGGVLLISAMVARFALCLTSMSVAVAAIRTILTFVPCFIAALTLRLTTNWRVVAGAFFLQIIVAAMLLQMLMPEFIMAQYVYIHAVINEMQSESALFAFINEKNGLSQTVLANYLFGVQAAGIVFSALLSLMLARSVQSQLFYPGGFSQEVLSFRGDKVGLLLLGVMLFAASRGNALAMNMLPALMFYFLLAGMSLCCNILARKKVISSLVLLVTPLLLLPFIMLPVYVIFGSLDSLFNFRLYLPASAGKRT